MENYSDNIYHCDSDVVVYFVTFNASFSRLDSLGKASAAYVLMYTVSQKQSKLFFQNFVKFQLTSIIFGTKMAKAIKLCKVHPFSTSPNLCQRITM